jgi:hypothetical protein
LKRLSEKDIETYVRFQETLSKKDRDRIEAVLSVDQESLLLADWLRLFYHNADSSVKQDNTPKPARIKLEAAEVNRSKDVKRFVLAAKSTNQNSGPENIKTLISQEYRSIVRMLYNAENEQVDVFTMSELIDEKDVILIRFQEDQQYRISVPGGRLQLDTNHEDIREFKNLATCEICLPMMTCRLSAKTISQDGFVAARIGNEIVSLEIILNNSDVSIIIDSEVLSQELNRVVLQNGQSFSLWSVANNVVLLPLEILVGKDVRLYFYN